MHDFCFEGKQLLELLQNSFRRFVITSPEYLLQAELNLVLIFFHIIELNSNSMTVSLYNFIFFLIFKWD